MGDESAGFYAMARSMDLAQNHQSYFEDVSHLDTHVHTHNK